MIIVHVAIDYDLAWLAILQLQMLRMLPKKGIQSAGTLNLKWHRMSILIHNVNRGANEREVQSQAD